jgi:hypothetical protein
MKLDPSLKDVVVSAAAAAVVVAVDLAETTVAAAVAAGVVANPVGKAVNRTYGAALNSEANNIFRLFRKLGSKVDAAYPHVT